MFNGRFISIHPVIESVYRDSGIDDLNIETAIADALELLGLIGLSDNYVERITDNIDMPIVKVEDYRALLPEDVVSINSIRKASLNDDGTILYTEEMIESSDIFHSIQKPTTPEMSELYPTARAFQFSEDEEGDLDVQDMVVVGPKATMYPNVPFAYKINNNVIFTNFESGYLAVVYKGYPVDEEGWLMIPDDEKYKQALKAHLIYKIDYRRWRAWPEKPAFKALLNDSEQQRDFYVAAARNKAHIPSIDKMEAIKNMYLRSITKPNEHVNGFKTLNIPERRRF